MPNILLTTRCNLSCKYCFAQEKLSSNRTNMTMENVRRVIDFLQRSNFPIFRVMGGEPTLHPQFNEIIRLAIAANMRVDVLSNATWSESTANLFERIPSKYLMFLLNIDHPDNYTSKQWGLIQRNLNRLKGRGGITLSFNVFEKQPRGNYVLDLATCYDFKYIRLSLSLPVMNAGNVYLPIEQLSEIAPFVLQFLRDAESKGISVQFDNAVPLCIFDEAQVGKLLLHGVYDLNRNLRCNPIIDIGPDLTIWSCFCLSPLKNRRLDEFQTLAEAQAYYSKVWSAYQDTIYPMEKCYTCLYREKWGCQGGCLSYAIMKDHGERFETHLADPPRNILLPSTTFALAEDIRTLYYDIPTTTCVLRKTSTNLEFEVDPAFQYVLPLLDGQHTLADIIAAFPATSSGSEQMQVFLKETIDEAIQDLLNALFVRGFLRTNTPVLITRTEPDYAAPSKRFC